MNVEDVKDPKLKVSVKISRSPTKIQPEASLIDCQRRLTLDNFHQISQLVNILFRMCLNHTIDNTSSL